jgi:hypothetical protein
MMLNVGAKQINDIKPPITDAHFAPLTENQWILFYNMLV